MESKTEAAVRPSVEDRVRIFMQYPGQIVRPIPDAEFIPFQLATVSMNGWVWHEAKEFEIEIEKCCIEVKPLGGISEEHGLRICQIRYGDQVEAWRQYNNPLNTTYNEAIKGICNLALAGRAVEIQIIDQLRQWGYALPYGQWSVQELVEFGIFKIVK